MALIRSSFIFQSLNYVTICVLGNCGSPQCVMSKTNFLISYSSAILYEIFALSFRSVKIYLVNREGKRKHFKLLSTSFIERKTTGCKSAMETFCRSLLAWRSLKHLKFLLQMLRFWTRCAISLIDLTNSFLYQNLPRTTLFNPTSNLFIFLLIFYLIGKSFRFQSKNQRKSFQIDLSSIFFTPENYGLIKLFFFFFLLHEFWLQTGIHQEFAFGIFLSWRLNH